MEDQLAEGKEIIKEEREKVGKRGGEEKEKEAKRGEEEREREGKRGDDKETRKRDALKASVRHAKNRLIHGERGSPNTERRSLSPTKDRKSERDRTPLSPSRHFFAEESRGNGRGSEEREREREREREGEGEDKLRSTVTCDDDEADHLLMDLRHSGHGLLGSMADHIVSHTTALREKEEKKEKKEKKKEKAEKEREREKEREIEKEEEAEKERGKKEKEKGRKEKEREEKEMKGEREEEEEEGRSDVRETLEEERDCGMSEDVHHEAGEEEERHKAGKMHKKMKKALKKIF